MAGGKSDSDEEGSEEKAGGKSDSDEEGSEEKAGGRSDKCTDGKCENGETCKKDDDCKSDSDEEGSEEMAGGRSDKCMDGKCQNGEACKKDDDCESDSDEEGSEEMAGGRSEKCTDGRCENGETCKKDDDCKSDSDEEGSEEMAGGRSESMENECIDGKCENGETCKKKDDCKSPQRFEYIKQTYEEYFPAEATTDSSQSSPIILQTIPHYSFSNYYTLNKHNHHHSAPHSIIGPHYPFFSQSGIQEHLPLEIPESRAKGFTYSSIHPPLPSENDLYQRLKSLPPLFRHAAQNNLPPNQLLSGLTNQQTTSNFNLNTVGSAQIFEDPRTVVGNDLNGIVEENLAPKKYYSTTKQAKNLYPSKHQISPVQTGSVLRFEDYGIRLRQPKAYSPKHPSSVADKLPPISVKNHGTYGLYNNIPTEYEAPLTPAHPSSMFDFGKVGANPDSILPHLLPPHMQLIKTNPQSFNVGYQSNDLLKKNNIRRPLVRFQYIHHIGPQKEEDKDASDGSDDDYPAYKVPGPPYNHHSVPLEKQKKRRGKLFQFKNIVKRLLGR